MKISERLLEYALLLVLFPFFCFALGSLGFLVRLALTKWYAALALLLTLVVLKFRSQTWKEFGIKTLIFVLLLLGFMTIGALHTDDLCDSRIYHKPAAILMADGWNPVWEPDVTKFYERNGIDPQSLKTSHLQYFPKGQWIVCAILYLATGNVDAGDYVDYAFMFALVILTYCALREWLGTGKWLAILASVTISLNPIAIMSLTNAHIDGLLGESLLMFLLASACFLKNGQKRWIPWILIPAIYGCSLKHTGPVYLGVAGFILTIPLLWRAIRKQTGTPETPVGMKEWLKLMIPIPFAVLILCANPFVTNTVNHTSPFYPLHSFDRVNHPVESILKDYYAEKDFQEAGWLRRMIYSYLIAQPSELLEVKISPPRIKEYGKISYWDSFIELNALGWIFGLELLLSAFLLIFVSRKTSAFWVLLALAATVLIQPHSWWARFVPQFWAFPALAFLVVLSDWEGIRPLETRLKWTVALLLGALCMQGVLTFSYTNLKMLAFIQLEQRMEKVMETPQTLVSAVCAMDENRPGEMQLFPTFNFYLSRKFQDAHFTNISVFQNHHGWQALPGKPLVYFNGILLCRPDGPIGDYDFNEIELDKKDVSIGKIPSSILWRLNQRFQQFLES